LRRGHTAKGATRYIFHGDWGRLPRKHLARALQNGGAMLTPRSLAAVAGTVVALLFAVRARADVHDHDELREDVLSCEEAVAHLGACCPHFDPTLLRCQYHYDYVQSEDACTGRVSSSTDEEHPALSLDESRCIRDRACGDLITDGVCDRAQLAQPDVDATSRTTTTAARAQVCP
jgi:hypothetical protein